MGNESHIPDQDLISAADGEISGRRKSQIEAHLAHCWTCRVRMKEIENAITDFVEAYHGNLDSQLPDAAASRAMLRARLSEIAAERPVTIWQRVSGPFA